MPICVRLPGALTSAYPDQQTELIMIHFGTNLSGIQPEHSRASNSERGESEQVGPLRTVREEPACLARYHPERAAHRIGHLRLRRLSEAGERMSVDGLDKAHTDFKGQQA